MEGCIGNGGSSKGLKNNISEINFLVDHKGIEKDGLWMTDQNGHHMEQCCE